jgi:hypothetical protein
MTNLTARQRCVGGVGAVFLVLTACSGRTGNQKVVIRRTTPPFALAPTPLSEQRQANLMSGAYLADRFEPTFRFRVGAGWLAYIHRPRYVFLSLGQADLLRPKALSFQRLTKVVEPKPSNLFEGKLVRPPQDLVGWLQHHPYMDVGATSTITVGGVQGIQVDAVFTSAPKRYGAPGAENRGCPAPCVILWTVEDKGASFVFFVKGEKVRFIILPVDGKDVVITIEALPNEFDQTVSEAEQVLTTVAFDSQSASGVSS